MELVYDIGAYNGDDTAKYLAQGFRVISIEASPIWAKKVEDRFKKEIDSGVCTVLNIGVSDRDGILPFYVSSNSIWSSFRRDMAEREGCAVEEISIETRKIGDVLREYGKPKLIKMDIEGLDYDCLRALDNDNLPDYLSFEADKNAGDDMIHLLAKRGYTHFRLVRQNDYSFVTVPEAGTLAHVKWSARQLIRHFLNRHPILHALAVRIAAVAKLPFHKRKVSGPAKYTHSSGPTPLEDDKGWYKATDFHWLWANVVQSQMIDTTWYDIHARR